MEDYSKHSDQELAALLKERNHAVFKELYNRYWGMLYRHAMRMLGDKDQAEDVLQDVFTSLWLKSGELEFTTSVSSFLYTSVRNRTLNQIDHSNVRENYMNSLNSAIEEGVHTTDDWIDERELASSIEVELAGLPEKMRKVFELSRIYNYSYKEIAEHLNITDHTVKKQMSNALKILRFKLNHFFFMIF